MSEEERFKLENELLMTKSKAQMINLYLDKLDQLQQKENIIKEVREYIENNTEEKKSWLNGIPDYRVFKGDTKELLEILDKVEE